MVGIVAGDDAQRLNLCLSFLLYPPPTLQSVVPLTDQRFSVTGVCCLRGGCALNRRTSLLGESERILPQ